MLGFDQYVVICDFLAFDSHLNLKDTSGSAVCMSAKHHYPMYIEELREMVPPPRLNTA